VLPMRETNKKNRLDRNIRRELPSRQDRPLVRYREPKVDQDFT